VGGLTRARYVRRGRTAGSPTGREPYGDGVPVVVRGRESRSRGEGAQVVSDVQEREACVMQDAATVLDVIGKRGARGLPVERLYRQLFNPQLFLMAFFRTNFCPFYSFL
jgi:hypothetical protein